MLVPVGLLLGIVLAFGRLYHEGEMGRYPGLRRQRNSLKQPRFTVTDGPARRPAGLELALELSHPGRPLVSVAAQRRVRDAELETAASSRAGFATLTGDSDAVFYAGGVDADGTLRDVFAQAQPRRAGGDRRRGPGATRGE